MTQCGALVEMTLSAAFCLDRPSSHLEWTDKMAGALLDPECCRVGAARVEAVRWQYAPERIGAARPSARRPSQALRKAPALLDLWWQRDNTLFLARLRHGF